WATSARMPTSRRPIGSPQATVSHNSGTEWIAIGHRFGNRMAQERGAISVAKVQHDYKLKWPTAHVVQSCCCKEAIQIITTTAKQQSLVRQKCIGTTVAAFYKRERTAQGWKAGNENAMGELQMLNFSKETHKLSITITKEAQAGSTVLINEEKDS